MNLLDAKSLAVDLMKQYIPNWNLAFDNAKRRFGMCNYRKQTISLSRYFITNSPEDEIKQTILHEIAHALAGSQIGHGYKWKIVARQIGMKNPVRRKRASDQLQEAMRQKANYVLNCPTCGPIEYRHRMGKQMRYRTYTCLKCGTSGLKWERAYCFKRTSSR